MDKPSSSNSRPRGSKRNIWDEAKESALRSELPTQEEDVLLGLEGVSAYDQRMLESSVMERMDEEAKEREKQVAEKRAGREIKRVLQEIREVKSSIAEAGNVLNVVLAENKDKDTLKRLESVKCRKANKEKQLKTLEAKLKRLQRVTGDEFTQEDEIGLNGATESHDASNSVISWALTGSGNTSSRENLIKSGHMTPFGSVNEKNQSESGSEVAQKKKLFLDDGFNDFLTSQSKPKKNDEGRQTKQENSVSGKKLPPKTLTKVPIQKKKRNALKSWIYDENNNNKASGSSRKIGNSHQNILKNENGEISDSSDKEYVPDSQEIKMAEEDDFEEEEDFEDLGKRKLKKVCLDATNGALFPAKNEEDVCQSVTKKAKLNLNSTRVIDDGKLKNYNNRLALYKKKIQEESLLDIQEAEDKDLGGGFKVPGRIWKKLYRYQKTGVRWLWELHSQQVGGILGDEMGLGKTIQIISFLAGLRRSKVRSRGVQGYGYEGLGPVLIITPTTVMHQWVKEIHTWWPPFRAAVLHDTGTYEGSRAQLVDNIATSNGILLTSYERARMNVGLLLDHGWHYVILDEGHKIRNPEAAVTNALKLFRTPHRLILSGSPVQNNLRELWSLFDFIFPGKLGTLPVFMEQFSVPIVQGGYSNATEVQVHTAYKCACKLRDTISPYLLRRMKRDVQASLELPEKNEQVLFCRLSADQVSVYKKYLDSDAVHSILCREMKVFAGLIQLRKICNHPDLYTGGPKIMVGESEPSPRDERSFGYYKRSGKMLVVASLLKIWKKQGHKVLLFSQSKAMVDVLQTFVHSRGYSYLIMHGGTPVQTRQPLIKKFNEDPSIFVFLLTTRVGGLGVNLTGANRVVIYDPDWNPSTDSQAQERSWRIGQRKNVTIYRLLTSGTIEEKIYHRQIFKQFLTNRVLKDPLQRRFFKSNDMHELFILKDYADVDTSEKVKRPKFEECTTETAAIFAGTGSEVRPTRITPLESPNREALGAVERSPNSSVGDQTIPISNGSAQTYCPVSVVTPKDIAEESENSKMTSNNEQNNYINTNHDSILKSCEINNHVTPDAKPNDINDILNPTTSTSTSTLTSVAKNMTESSVAGSCDEDVKEDLPENSIEKTVEEDFETEISTSVSTTEPVKPKDIVANAKSSIPKSSASSNSYSSLKESLRRARLKFQQNKKAASMQESKRRRKRKRKPPVIDGEIVSNVASVEEYKGGKERKDSEQKNRRATDDYVLEKLFKRAGVHSALQHNTIMDSAHPDFALVEVEAERVAKESVRNLRLSRRQYKFPTGNIYRSPVQRFGKKVEATAKKTFKDNSRILEERGQDVFKASQLSCDGSDEDSSSPLSASQLLSSMRRRNHEEIHKQEQLDAAAVQEENELFGTEMSNSNGDISLSQNPTAHDEMMTNLRNYIAFQCEVDGQARTSEIMREFGSKVKPEFAAIFKSILKQLCDSMEISGTGEKLWKLKPEFR